MINLKYKILFSNEIDRKLQAKIMECFNSTFHQKKADIYFKWKYLDNPFGESIHILVFYKKKLVSCRAFWRLDINETEAYQCVDTSVISAFQGKGIFRNSTIKALKILKDKIVYNYPNQNSYPAYLKLGWEKNEVSHIKLNFVKKAEKMTPYINWSYEKLVWRFKHNPQNIYYNTFINGYFLILSKRKGFFVLLGKTRFNLKLKNVKPHLVFSYDYDFKGLKVPKKRILTLSRNLELKKISFFNYDMM